MSKINRNFKASVFTHLFGEPKNELELYNAFSPVQYPPDTTVIDLTLTDALYMDRINDLSFSVGEILVVFYEHNSTLCDNMPLRELFYCGRVYEKLIDNSAMYAEKRIMMANMLLSEWRIEDAKTVWQKEAEEIGEKRGEMRGFKKARAEYEPVIAEKDAEIAKLKAQLGQK